MAPTRRQLLAALLPPPAAAGLRFDADDQGSATLRSDSPPGLVRLPGLRARLRPTLLLAGTPVTAIAYTREDQTGTLEMLALAGWSASRLVLLALEPLSWRGPAARLQTHAHPAGDGLRLELRRDAALRQAGLWRHESWTDYLAWSPATMTDAPPRPPLPDSLQARLATRRAALLAWLQTPRDDAWQAPDCRHPLGAA